MTDEEENTGGSEEPEYEAEPKDTNADQEPTSSAAEELIRNAGPTLDKIRLDPNALSHLGDGLRAMREGLSDFFVANDRGAERTKDTADRVIALVAAELDREGLTPEQRLEFIRAGERRSDKVAESEEKARAANERTFGKIVGIAAGATVGVVVLGYLVKEGRLR